MRIGLDVRRMKIKIADILIGLTLLLSSLDSILQYSNLGLLSIVFAVMFFVSGFAVLRAYSWARYILYVNSAILLLIVFIGLYTTNFEGWYIGIIPLVLAIIFGAYGFFRYREPSAGKPLKKEVLVFTMSLVAFSALVLAIDYLVGPTGNVQMGVFKLK